ncbi:AMP-binding protein [Streptomyces sp. NPDC056405]|uniref:AMP-binding protein n=1 Tax=Streptomyces sp. NPDC056405 TaxID=3345811 RepID=UPI0035DEFC03
MSIENRILHAWKQVMSGDDISPDSNFFEVGGDSVAALRVVNELAENGLTISLHDFYRAATVTGQARYVTEQDGPDGSATGAPEAAGAEGGRPVRLPLTPLQSVMVVEALRRPDSDAYWLTLAYALPRWAGPWEAATAWRETVRANPTLRTHITLDGDGSGPIQVIGPEGMDLRIAEPGVPGRGPGLARWCHDRSTELRGLFPQELLRAYYVPGEPAGAHAREATLVVISHHALMDGWSMEQCVGDFHSRLARPHEPLRERPSGGVYASWLEATGALETSRAFWEREARGARPAPELSFTRQRNTPGQERNADQLGREERLSQEAAAGLSRFALEHGLTRAGVFTTLWIHLLRQYQDRTAVGIGLTVSTRPAATLPGIGEASGFLINTLPLWLEPSEDFAADCARVMEKSVAITEHAHLPYSEVVAAAGLPGMSRLFTSTLIFQNHRRRDGAPEAPVRPLLALGSSADELSLTVDMEGEDLMLDIAWDAEMYSRASVASLVRDLEYWLTHLDDIDPAAGLVTPLDAARALSGTVARPGTWCVGRLLESGAPEQAALAHGDQIVTYAELSRRASVLADRLAADHGVGPGDRVALDGQRGIEGAIAICAVWMLGAAWCPISPSWPVERRERVIVGLRPKAVISLADLAEPTAGARPPAPDPERMRELLGHTMPSESAAYYVPTSGSTGVPKLVALSAGGLRPLVDAWLSCYELTRPQRVLQFGSWTSDVFLGDLLKALATGGTLVICSDETRVDLTHVEKLIRRWRITLLESTPVMVAAVVRRLSREPEPPAELSTLIVGADAFRLHEAQEMAGQLWEGVRLYNGYGLSEATIESVVQECVPGLASRSGLCPIGRPLPGVAVAVVDSRGRPLPHGALGELVISGPQVGLGYLTEDGLSDSGRFGTARGTRSLRTGDLVRYGEGGRLEFHGRRDGQTKVRGHRVELGEVEDCLLRIPEVKEAFVFLADRVLEPELVAFVGAPDGIDERTVRESLRRRLPDPAVPRRVLVEPFLPRGESGKLDRVLMRSRAANARPITGTVDPPAAAGGQTDLAATLTKLWSEVLERPVSPHRSFFDQGGSSILAMRLHSRISEILPDYDIPIAQLFAHPTITSFCASLEVPPPPQEPVGSDRPPTGELAVLQALERGELDVRTAMRLLREGPGER